MWGTLALTVLQHLPSILSFAEGLIPGSGTGNEKKLTATTKMVEYEGALALDQRVKDAKSALIDAQVAYLNAMEAAAAEARTLGIVLPVPPVPATGVALTSGSGGVVAAPLLGVTTS